MTPPTGVASEEQSAPGDYSSFTRTYGWDQRVEVSGGRDLPTLKLELAMAVLARRDRPDASVLELGCGNGRILTSIRARDSQLRLAGIDLATDHIRNGAAVNAGRSLDFVNGDGQRLPFRDGAFDYVVIFDFLEHVPDPAASLAEAARVLRPGGVLHAVVPAENQPGTLFWLSKKLFRRHFKETTAGHIQQYSIADVERLVSDRGLAIIDRRYSYHLIGGSMDYILFTLLLNRRLADVFWSTNQYYRGADRSRSSPVARVLNRLMSVGNAIAYFESRLLQRRRLLAAAVHLTATKPQESGRAAG